MNKILIFLSTIFLSIIPVSTKSYGWGFSKNNNHTQPYIGKYKEEIEGTNSYYVGDENEKCVYLTFDAGYDNGNLIKILDILDTKEVTATFFLTGDFLERFSDLTIEITRRNHIVGNHTWSHKNITSLSETELENDRKKVEKKFYELTGKKINNYFRPPAGVFNKNSLTTVKNLGYNTIFWSIAYKDWDTSNQTNTNKSIESVVNNLHNGAIILLHTVSDSNVKSLPIIIDKIREEGYEIKSLDSLIYNCENYIL